MCSFTTQQSDRRVPHFPLTAQFKAFSPKMTLSNGPHRYTTTIQHTHLDGRGKKVTKANRITAPWLELNVQSKWRCQNDKQRQLKKKRTETKDAHIHWDTRGVGWTCDGWMAAFRAAPFRPRPLPPLRPPNCVNGKATAAFANFAAAATKATAQLQQELHKCICIYSYI